MCYSLTASIIGFSLMLVSSIFLFFYSSVLKYLSPKNILDNKVVAIVMFGASTMQVAEMLIHSDFECQTNRNKFGSRLGFLSLQVVQPFFSFMAAFLYSYRSKLLNKIYNNVVLLLSIVSILCYATLTAFSWPIDHLDEWCTTERNDCSMPDVCDIKWDWAPNETYQYFPYWISVFVVPSLMLYNRAIGVIATIALMPTIMWITDVIGASASCFWAPFLSVLIALLGPLLANDCVVDRVVVKPTTEDEEVLLNRIDL